MTETQAEHTVRIEPHGRTLRVRAGVALLEAALEAGLNLPHSCKSGHCASCRARLRSGEIRYPGPTPPGITPTEVAAGQILLCQARALTDLVVEARLVADVANVEIKTLPCRIARLVPLAPDVMQVWLRLPTVERLRFQPGQYLDVLLENGRRRSFSIASPPHDSELIELHVRRVSGGGFTERLFAPGKPAASGTAPTATVTPGPAAGTPGVPVAPTALAAGALLTIEGPIGQFVYHRGTGPMIMVGGGTGFAPLKSILRHVLETGIERPVALYFGARHAGDVYESALLEEWARRYPRFTYTPVLSEAQGAETRAYRTGWVHEAVLADHPSLDGYEVYAAGPPAMIEALRTHFPRHGLPPGRLYFDSFDYAPDARVSPGR